MQHRLQSSPKRLVLRAHLLEATLADTSCKVCGIFLRGIAPQLLVVCARVGFMHLLRRAVDSLADTVVRDTVELVKGIVEFLLLGEQNAQSVVPYDLMDKRVLHVCHINVVRNNDGHLACPCVVVTLHPALACAWQCGYFLFCRDNAHWRMQPFR